MKHLLIITSLFSIVITVKGQNYFPLNGNVGIGTSNPLNGLNVFNMGNFNSGSIRFGHSGTYDGVLSLGYNSLTGRDALKLSYFPHNSITGQTDLMVLDVNGNVGIGTSSPLTKLHLNRSLNDVNQTTDLVLSQFNGFSKISGLYTDAYRGGISFSTNNQSSGENDSNILFIERMRITASGSVGIGSTTPDGFQVNAALSNESSKGVNNIRMGTLGGTPRLIFDYNGSAPFEMDNSGGQLRIFNPGVVRMVVNPNGYVGIGTTSPDAMLAVAGQVHTQEVKVTTTVPGPDYVFEKDYALPSLDSIKTYIDKNKHLPEVPSAKEMEMNGVNLGEMNMLLLKKIEELTLYVIELKKRDEVQQKEIEDLKKIKN